MYDKGKLKFEILRIVIKYPILWPVDLLFGMGSLRKSQKIRFSNSVKIGEVMAIDNSEIIDAISINDAEETVLTITDHLDWKEENEHLLLLQEKINNYLGFIESEEIFDSYPKARGRKVVIEIVSQFPISNSASSFIESANSVIKEAGFELRQKLFEKIKIH